MQFFTKFLDKNYQVCWSIMAPRQYPHRAKRQCSSKQKKFYKNMKKKTFFLLSSPCMQFFGFPHFIIISKRYFSDIPWPNSRRLLFTASNLDTYEPSYGLLKIGILYGKPEKQVPKDNEICKSLFVSFSVRTISKTTGPILMKFSRQLQNTILLDTCFRIFRFSVSGSARHQGHN